MTFNYRKLSLFYKGFALLNYLNRRLILVPRSDLFRPLDFYGFDRFEVSHFLPFLRKDARRRFQFLHAKSCEDGTFFLEFALFSLIKTQLLSLQGMMSV